MAMKTENGPYLGRFRGVSVSDLAASVGQTFIESFCRRRRRHVQILQGFAASVVLADQFATVSPGGMRLHRDAVRQLLCRFVCEQLLTTADRDLWGAMFQVIRCDL